jgi:hypothetical protein
VLVIFALSPTIEASAGFLVGLPPSTKAIGTPMIVVTTAPRAMLAIGWFIAGTGIHTNIASKTQPIIKAKLANSNLIIYLRSSGVSIIAMVIAFL